MVEQRLGYMIKRAQQALRSQMDHILDEIGLTTPQYAALSILEEDSGISNAELARRCFLTPQTMHKMVGGMETKGLLERQQHPDHGRKKMVLLTPKGKSLLEHAHNKVAEIEGKMTAELSDKALEQTVHSLQKVIHVLDAF
ncbi:MAG: MarR family winged helix-turn-helix transcriptional regulator [Bacteroidota bacterium]